MTLRIPSLIILFFFSFFNNLVFFIHVILVSGPYRWLFRYQVYRKIKRNFGPRLNTGSNIKMTIKLFREFFCHYNGNTHSFDALLKFQRINLLDILRFNIRIDINVEVLLQILFHFVRYYERTVVESEEKELIEHVICYIYINI